MSRRKEKMFIDDTERGGLEAELLDAMSQPGAFSATGRAGMLSGRGPILGLALSPETKLILALKMMNLEASIDVARLQLMNARRAGRGRPK